MLYHLIDWLENLGVHIPGMGLMHYQSIRALLAAGYEGPFSFEPFASEVHDAPDPEAALKQSIEFIRGAIA